jgi:hypothetical protein
MPDVDLNETEMAAGAAIAMEMAREDRRQNAHIEKTRMSASSTAGVIAFVAITSIGMLVLMMLLDK